MTLFLYKANLVFFTVASVYCLAMEHMMLSIWLLVAANMMLSFLIDEQGGNKS